MRAYSTHRDANGVSLTNSGYQDQVKSLFDFLCKSDGLKKNSVDLSTSLSYSNPSEIREATIICKESGIFAGREEIEFLRRENLLNWEIKFFKKDGEMVSSVEKIAEVKAEISQLLAYERVVLNFLQRMSGIATYTKKMIALITNQEILLCPTRKTLWGIIDKKAVLVGGGGTHRLNLNDAIMLKENHLLQNGDISGVIKRVLAKMNSEYKFFEVEVECVNEAILVADLINNIPRSVILLDNFSITEAKKTSTQLKKSYPNLIIELSGGINENNLSDYSSCNVDLISMGALTNNPHSLDLSMRVI